MEYAFIIALIVICVLAYLLSTQKKAGRVQAEKQQQLLNDYQRRVDEQQQLLNDYRSLEKNFENVGQGYEQALLAFDKLEEVRTQTGALKDTVDELQQAVAAGDADRLAAVTGRLSGLVDSLSTRVSQ